MQTSPRIPVTIVTGFLGSGKTTLLNRVLSEAHGKRIAIIENEFGEVSIDDALLVDANQTVFKMSNGCLCCTVNGDLVATLLELSKRSDEFDYVIIETTGVANPAPVVQTFMLNEDIADAFVLDAVVATVDAKHVLLHLASKECKEQIALADIILLNKLDLVDASEVELVEQKLRALNTLAVLHKTERSNVAFAQILDQGLFAGAMPTKGESDKAHAHDHDDHEHCEHDHGDCDHDHDAHDHGGEACDHDHHDGGHLHAHHHDEDVVSVGCELPGELSRERFNAWFGPLIRTQGDRIYRCKGVLSVANDSKKVVLQAVHSVVEVTSGGDWAQEKRLSRIVFIGKDLNADEIVAGFKSCLVV
ncbi:MAG: GTP-binding protein [Candidatus Obscuribacter sp.]|jgi:G3E family GTPase|nr:GTP-binding protein [Candidatus Obscuribacter sp.]